MLRCCSIMTLKADRRWSSLRSNAKTLRPSTRAPKVQSWVKRKREDKHGFIFLQIWYYEMKLCILCNICYQHPLTLRFCGICSSLKSSLKNCLNVDMKGKTYTQGLGVQGTSWQMSKFLTVLPITLLTGETGWERFHLHFLTAHHILHLYNTLWWIHGPVNTRLDKCPVHVSYKLESFSLRSLEFTFLLILPGTLEYF